MTIVTDDEPEPIAVGRYVLHRQIAGGGMATIHLARVVGDVGFSRIVAAKRLRPELAEDREFVSMFLDEARIASKVHHKNVVPVLDVGTTEREVVLVQEYVHGASLAFLLNAAHEAHAHVPIPVAATIACHVLAGLHAAHQTVDELGMPLEIVHRDVSPQNIMVATDGSARLLDFGIAKAAARVHVTRKGTFKGKLAYAAPEHIRGCATRQSDIYSATVVLWELLVGQRMHRRAGSDTDLVREILTQTPPAITEALAEERAFSGSYRWDQLEALAPIVNKGLATDVRRRWTTAAEMEEAIAAAMPLASANDVAAWLSAIAGDMLAERERIIANDESKWRAAASAAEHAERARETATTEAVATVAEAGPPPAVVERRRARGKEIGAWCMFAIALVSVIALASRDRGDAIASEAGATAATVPSGEAREAAAPEQAVQTQTPPAPAQASKTLTLPPTITPPAPAGEPTITDDADEAEPRATPARRAVKVTPHLTAAKPAAAAAQPRLTIDCSPPYYFHGAKKIFKPACI